MFGGVSLVGVVTAPLASWIVQRVAEEDTAQQVATAAQINQVRTDLEQRVETLGMQMQRLTEAVTQERNGEEQ